MHTIMVITGGLVLLAIFCGIGWMRGKRPGLVTAARAFIPIWFIAAIINLSIGVLTAGYTVMQELPILVPVFGLPALVAWGVLRWGRSTMR